MGGKLNLGHLVFETTEACNQNCRFCYNHWRPQGSSPTDARAAARTLRRIYRQADIGSISFSGGEPTLLSNLHDLVLRCRFRGSAVNVLTNGTLLSEDDIVNFASIGLSALQIPLLSSNPDVHDALTGVAGSWTRAHKAAEQALIRLGADHFAAVLILTAENAATVGETLEMYGSMGIRNVMVNRFNIGGNGIANRRALSLGVEGLRNAFRTASGFALSHPQMNFVSGVCTPICMMDPVDYPGIRFSTCSTELDNRPLTVNYRGDVRFCNHSPFVMGNVWERGLSDILSDESIKSRYAGVPQQCGDCRLYYRCKGGCRAASEQVFGTFNRVDPVISE